MSLVLAGLGILLITLPHAVPAGAGAQRDSRWSVTGTWLGLRLLGVATALTAAPTALRALGIHSMADACHRLASPAPPGSAVGTVATVVALVVLARTLYVRARLRSGRNRTRVESTLGTHRPHTAHPNTELVVVPTDAWLAYAVPGRPNQIVVSDGVVEALSESELGALVGHEVAHLRLGHHRALSVLAELDGIAGAWARRFTDRIRLMLERAADDDAATGHGAPAVHGALCGSPSGLSTTVMFRREALEAPAVPRSHPLLPIGVAAAVSAAGVVFTASAAAADHGVWGLVGLCGGV